VKIRSAVWPTKAAIKKDEKKHRQTRIWHVPAKHANRMDARAHTSTLADDASFSGVCRPKFTKLGTRVEQPCALKKFILELQYSAAFARESKGDRKYAKFRHFLAHRVV